MTSVLRNLSINLRLILLVSFLSIGLFTILWMSLSLNKQSLLDEKYLKTRHVVEAVHSVVDFFYQQEQSGALSKEEAQKAALKAIEGVRYGGQEYFWINDYNAVMVMHPIKPELTGRDLTNTEDPNGKKLFSEFVRVVKAERAGFVDYLWPKPGSEEPVEKISYVKGFEPWGWILGSGIYLDDVNTQFASSVAFLGTIGLVMVIAGAVLSVVILASITVPLKNILTAMDNISAGDGDLNKRLPVSGRDQLTHLGESFNGFVEKLRQTIKEAVSLNDQVFVSSDQLRTIAGEADNISNDQLRMTNDMTNAIEEVSHAREHVIANTNTTQESASNTSEKTRYGKESVNKTIHSLQLLADELDHGVQSVEKLAEESQNIGAVLDVIRGIAEQTNLLALNAAIEAARAGEQGRGFAVVADEVRTLASRTQSSTDEIQTMIENLQSGAKEAETRITSSHEHSKQTTVDISQASEALDEIESSVAAIANASNEITESVNQQNDAVQNLSHLTDRIMELTSQSAAEIGKTTDSSESLASSSNRMKEVMGGFKV